MIIDKLKRISTLILDLLSSSLFTWITFYIWDSNSPTLTWFICLFTISFAATGLVFAILWFKFNIVKCPKCGKIGWSTIHKKSSEDKIICCSRCGHIIKVVDINDDRGYDQDAMP